MNQRLKGLLFALSVASVTATGQLSQERTDRSSATELMAKESVAPTAAVPLDAPIDAESYLVGPGDLFSVTISTVPPQAMPLTVTAQGTLVIPMVGDIPAAGKNLAAFQADALAAIKRRYLQGDPTVSLVAPRRIIVRVRGAGVIEGSYVASASDRVQSLLARGDIRRTTARPDAILRQLERDPVPVLRRSIRIFRSGVGPLDVDLERYEATREAKWSPYLQEGDEVVFSAATSSRGTVTVGGAVLAPWTFEWKSEDRLTDVLLFARGLADHAASDSIQLLRASGAIEWHDATADVAVQPGDRIVVMSKESRTHEALVSIKGEVRHPGQYPIMAPHTRLAEAIAMAGGLTSEAMMHAVGVYRRAPEGDEHRWLLLTAERGNAALEDTAYVRIETQARLFGERVSLNAARALADPSSDDNVSLLPGDRIVVPRRTGTVYVFGQVREPGHQPFRPGDRLDDYVRRAGGYTERAKDDEVSVIKYASRQWLSPDDATIEEGDMIWVPREVERDLAYNLGLVGQIAGIVSAAATLILLVTQVGK